MSQRHSEGCDPDPPYHKETLVRLTFAIAIAASPALAEPFQIDGRLSHCGYTDASVYCEFHAGGLRYVASSSDGTPYDDLEGMFDLGTNTPMRVSGQILYSASLTRDVTLSAWEPGPPDGSEPLRASLEGYWRDADSPGGALLIHGGTWEVWQNNTPGAQAIFDLTGDCGDGRAPALAVTEYDTKRSETTCWVLHSVTDSSLHLWHPDTGQDLRFTK